MRSWPLFPVTTIGSWPRPGWLLDAVKRKRENLAELQDQATLLAIKLQEDAGADIITDGEQRRDNFFSYVADRLEGVRLMSMAELLDFVDDKAAFEAMLGALDVPAYAIKNPVVVEKIRVRKPLAMDDFHFLREHTHKPVKVTLPGPYLLARSSYVSALTSADPELEFQQCVGRILHYAAWADKYDGQVHSAPLRGLVYTRNEPLGIVAVLAPEEPSLLGYLSVCLPLVAMGNAIVSVPSASNPLPALDLVRVIEASDVPAGVWNVVTGHQAELVKPLVDHLGVASVWHFGDPALDEQVLSLSTGNLKQTFTAQGKAIDWSTDPHPEFLRRAVQDGLPIRRAAPNQGQPIAAAFDREG